jgi:hypothetical protein
MCAHVISRGFFLATLSTFRFTSRLARVTKAPGKNAFAIRPLIHGLMALRTKAIGVLKLILETFAYIATPLFRLYFAFISPTAQD